MVSKILHKDLSEIMANPLEGISAFPEESMQTWMGTIEGPSGSHYDGKKFRLKIEFSDEHPMKPPWVVFVDECFHPNVSKKGEICLDTLSDGWSPAVSVRTMLLSIQSLLAEPNPDDPLNHEAAVLYKEHPERFQKRVDFIVKKSKVV